MVRWSLFVHLYVLFALQKVVGKMEDSLGLSPKMRVHHHAGVMYLPSIDIKPI